MDRESAVWRRHKAACEMIRAGDRIRVMQDLGIMPANLVDERLMRATRREYEEATQQLEERRGGIEEQGMLIAR